MLPRAFRVEHGQLHRRLFLTILAGLLPVVLLSYLTLLSSAQTQKRELIEAVQNTMQALITAVDSEFEVSIAALETMGASSRLKSGDLEGFHAEARELMQRRAHWVNVVLSTPDAQQLVNARRPFGAKLPSKISPDAVAHTARTGRPWVGNILIGPGTGKPVYAVHVPVLLPGGALRVLSAPTMPASVQELLRRQKFPERSLVSIVDRNYNIVARSLNHAGSVGKRASPTLVKLLKDGRPEGWAITTTLEGKQVYTIFQRSASSGWTAVIGIPLDVLDGPVRRSYRVLAGTILVAALLGIAAALMLGRPIIHPMMQLRNAADAAGRGEAPAIPDTEIPEIRQVAEAIAAAHSERERLLASERQAHQHEREARLLAENANRAKDEFLAMLGHELRNPLAPIYTAAQLLKMPGTDGARVRQLSAIVERQAGHLTRLVDDILDVSRVTRKVIVLQREPINLNAILPQAVEQVQELCSSHRHALTVMPAAEEAWVCADRTRMVQVLVNLLHNAGKYTPDGGRLELAVSVTADQVSVAVRDNGPGIPDSLLPRLFDLFSQSERTLDRAQGGLGLGLSLVKGLVELHDGTVRVESGDGEGSTFTVVLPRIARPEPLPSPGPARAVAPGQRVRVMVVDDNRDAANMLVLYLEQHGGFAVSVFSDPFQALAAAIADCPDALLLDIGMPGMDGYELARRLKAHAATRHAILFAISGYGQQQDKEMAFAAGFAQHFVKPVDVAQLVAKLEESLRALRQP